MAASKIVQFVSSLIFIFSLRANGGELRKLFLSAVAGDEDNQIAMNNYLIAIEESKVAKSALLPHVDFEASYNLSDSGGDQRNYMSSAGFTFFMPLFDISKKMAVQSSQTSIQIKQIQESYQKQQFLFLFLEALLRMSERKSQYYFAQEESEYQQRFFQKLGKQLKIEWEREHPGQSFDPEKSVLLASLREGLVSYENNVANKYLEYENERERVERSFLGEKLPTIKLLHPFKNAGILNDKVEDAINIMRSTSKTLAISKLGIRIADLNLSAATKARLPTIGLNGSISANQEHSSSSGDSWNEQFVGIGVRIPLISGGEIRAKKKIAELKAKNAQLEYQGLVASLATEMHKLFREMQTKNKILTAKLASYSRSKENLRRFLGNGEPANPGLINEEDPTEQRGVVLLHYQIAAELVRMQHDLLLTMLRIKFLKGSIQDSEIDWLEKYRLIDCNSFSDFMELETTFLN